MLCPGVAFSKLESAPLSRTTASKRPFWEARLCNGLQARCHSEGRPRLSLTRAGPRLPCGPRAWCPSRGWARRGLVTESSLPHPLAGYPGEESAQILFTAKLITPFLLSVRILACWEYKCLLAFVFAVVFSHGLQLVFFSFFTAEILTWQSAACHTYCWVILDFFLSHV